MPRKTACLIAAALCLGCRPKGAGIEPLTVSIAVSPAVDFGSAYVGARRLRSFEIASAGSAPETATVTLLGPFALETPSPVSVPAGATVPVPIRFAPTAAGAARGTAHVVWDEGSAEVALTGTGLAWPVCAPDSACEEAAFDPDAGVCRRGPLPDGTGCAGGSSCLAEARCEAGACVGVPLDCDDHDACTRDSCVQGRGCVHEDASASCAGDAPCQIYACDPARGCVSSPAPDGTVCSTDESCETAEACLGGRCVGLPLPDGTPCKLWWAPCASDSSCHAGACRSPTAEAEEPGTVRWSWAPDGGPTPLSVPAVDELGNAYVTAASSSLTTPNRGPMDLVSLDACGNLRWENPGYPGVETAMLAGEELLFATPGGQELVALYRETGQPLWTLPGFALAPRSPGEPLGRASLSALALSPKGPIYVAGELESGPCDPIPGDGGDGGGCPGPSGFAAAVSPGGQLLWTTALGAPPTAGTRPVVDRDGNLYLALGGDVPSLVSLDPTGTVRFAEAVDDAPYSPSLALGTDRLVDATSGSLYDLDGGIVGPPWLVGIYPAGSGSALVDGSGSVYFAVPSGDLVPDIELAKLVGLQKVWASVLPAGTRVAGLALGQGQLFVAEQASCAESAGCPSTGVGGTLVAYDADGGGWSWELGLGLGVVPSGPLTLSNTANLIVASGGELLAVFAGRQHPPFDAPWSRTGGSAANQSSAAPPPVPQPPSGAAGSSP